MAEKKSVLSKKIGKQGWKENLDEIKNSNDVLAKHAILTEAVKHLFNTIGPDDILRKDVKGQWIFENKVLHSSEVEDLKVQALALLHSKFWRVLQADIKFQLNRKMYLETNITMDMMWGKLVVYLNDIINTRIERMKR